MTLAGSARPNETLRQIVHIAFGFVALSLRWLPLPGAVLLVAAALAHNLFLIPRYARPLWRARDETRGFSVGIATYPAVLLGAVLVFHDRLHLAAAVWGLLAFGDGAATLVGRGLGGPALPWNPCKSWAGALACAVIGTVAAAGLVAFVSGRPDQGASIPFAAALLPCALVAAAAAFVESLPTKLDDNLTTSAVAAALFAGWAAVVPTELAGALPAVTERLPMAAAVAGALAVLAFAARTVDVPGAVVGFAIAVVVLVTGGWPSFAVFAAFFVVGSVATRIGAAEKERRGIAEPKRGRRGWSHAVANGGVGAGLSFLSIATGRPELLRLAFTGAIATAAFDTVATEIGKARGERTGLLPGLRPVAPGTAGGVSAEGTAAGLLAAVVVAGAGAAVGLYGVSWVFVVVAGAAVGATLESVAGAWLDGRGLLDRGALNVLNTAVGAAVCLGLGVLLGV